MNRYSAYGKSDTQWQPDGDMGWIGVDNLHERSFLQPRMLARCENKRLWDGPAATRKGTSFPGDFNPVFEGRIIGSYIYSNVNSEEVMLVATAKDPVGGVNYPEGCTYVWQLQFGKDPIKINLAAGNSTGSYAVEFCQAYDKVLLIRRPSPQVSVHGGAVVFQGILIWDGWKSTDPGTHTGTFDVMMLSDDGLHLTRNTWFAEPFENRVLYYFAYGLLNWRTQFNLGDVLDPTSYDDVFGVFRVSAAGSDQITRLLAFQKGSVIAFMRNSVYLVENFTVDPNQTTQRVLSSKVGSMGNKVPIVVGAEAFFLSEPGGIYKVSQIITDRISTEPIPISMPIQPIIDRIDWHRLDSLGLDFVACSASLGAYVYFAVPLDEKSGANDAVLVYNTVTSQWESVPDWWDDPNFRINAMHVTHYDRDRRLFALDYKAKKIYLLYDGIQDHINGNIRQVKDVIETRGYVCGDPGGMKLFERAVIGIRTSAPNVTVTAITDGVDEEYELAHFSKDFTQSYIHGRGPITTDPDAPKRQDYNSGGEQFVIQDFESLPVGSISVLPEVATTLVGQTEQQSLERFSIRQTGRWVSIRVENTSGQCDVLGVAVEGIPVSETIKTSA